ncbi:hypothetical protein C7H19_18780 [Aphanothece hegewaldii CCALA 016]|uniref:Uncharacterized protein n=1 Tax=Aphanothece hegewaldii CCALA 016 TaxID=2107694 RepID=A0A2T1LTP2_9CHRO|nr:hypothetical protein [Aphanothece hegewaldii]PSF34475.1 hypothetical protein C7H19_18780 [Aphanothece hegewaldii CCALA 016]
MITTFNQQWVKTIGLVSGLIACLGSISYLQLSRINIVSNNLGVRDVQQEANTEKVKLNFVNSMPSFGFKNLVANWSLLQFIQYYGDDDARKVTGFDLSPDYLDIIVKNDPRFVKSYLLISPASSINAGLPLRTISAMNKGLEKLSPQTKDAYLIWLYKGVDELLFLGDINAAKNSYSMAADWAKIANNTRLERAARGTVEYLSNNPDSSQAQVGAWFLVWVNARDQNTRKMAQNNIEKLGGKIVFGENGQVFAVPPKSLKD